ncbi:MAG: hypothetical protein M3O71_09815 [Bacteroidota bacterium]|nr:hypothetical protein [Bacteroidota bacterium]
MKHYPVLSGFHRDCGFVLPENPMFSISGNQGGCNSGVSHFTADFFCIMLYPPQEIWVPRSTSGGEAPSGTLAFFKPGEVVTTSAFSSGKDGWQLLMHREFLDDVPLQEELDRYNCFGHPGEPLLKLRRDEEKLFRDLLQRIESEYLNQDEHSKAIIIAALSSLLKYMERFCKRQRMEQPENTRATK